MRTARELADSDAKRIPWRMRPFVEGFVQTTVPGKNNGSQSSGASRRSLRVVPKAKGSLRTTQAPPRLRSISSAVRLELAESQWRRVERLVGLLA